MAIEYQQFLDFNVDTFVELAAAWDTVETNAGNHRDTLSGTVKPNISDEFWQGQASVEANAMYTELDGRFEGVENSARELAAFIRDTGEKWRECQDSLKGTLSSLDGEELTFDGQFVKLAGLGEGASANRAEHMVEAWEEKHGKSLAETCEGYLNEIADRLDEADIIDGDFTIVLERSFTSTDTTDDTFPTDPETDPEVVEGELAAEIMSDDNATDEEVALLDQLLEENGDNEAFATTLYSNVSAENLGNWTASAAYADGVTDDELVSVQESLGTTLGVATSANPDLAESWATQFVNYGGAGHDYTDADGNTVNMLGYSVLGPIMSYGEYPSEFLVPVTNNMMEVQFGPIGPAGDTDKYGDYFNRNLDGQYPSTNPFDPAHPGWVDPLNYGLQALGQNPQASIDFFSQPDDFGYTDANGDPLSFVDRILGHDTNTGSLDDAAVGAAIESAATGLPYDAPLDTEPVPHTEENAAFTSHLVDYYGQRPYAVEGMETTLAEITANYITDFHSGLNNVGSENAAEVYMPPNGAQLQFSDNDIARLFLENLGAHENSYEIVSNASLGATQMEVGLATVNGEGPEGMSNVVSSHANMMAYLDHGMTAAGNEGAYDGVPASGPGPTSGDWVAAGAKSVVGAIPYAGALGSEAIGMAHSYLKGGETDPVALAMIAAQQNYEDAIQQGGLDGAARANDALNPLVIDLFDSTADGGFVLDQFQNMYHDAYDGL